MSIQRRDFLRASLATGAMVGLGQADAVGREQEKRSGRAAVSKRLLILGGTGFLGPQIVEEAKRRGHTLTLFNRGKTRPGLFPEIEKLHGDRNEPGAIKPLEGKQWDAVIDTSANVPRWVTDAATLLAPNVKRYLYISSISVYNDTSKPGADETAAVGTIEDVKTEKIDGRTYGPLKALSEKAAEAAMPGRVAVVRPGLIVGPEDPSDRFTYWPVRVARGGEVLAPGKPDDPVQLIDVRDLGAWLVRLVEDETTGVFDALGPKKPLSIGAMLDACKKAGGSDARFTWADAAFLAEQKVNPWSDMPVWVPSEGESAGFHRRNNARAIKAGLTFRPIADTAKATLDWFKTLPEERQAKLRAGLAADREARVLAAWKARPGAKAV